MISLSFPSHILPGGREGIMTGDRVTGASVVTGSVIIHVDNSTPFIFPTGTIEKSTSLKKNRKKTIGLT